MSQFEALNYDDVASWTLDQMPTGLVAEGGSAAKYITGGWRSIRPEWNADACTSCMLCWIACPDSSVLVENATMTGIDYDHCKGCGLCVKECRFNALVMVPENMAKEA